MVRWYFPLQASVVAMHGEAELLNIEPTFFSSSYLHCPLFTNFTYDNDLVGSCLPCERMLYFVLRIAL